MSPAPRSHFTTHRPVAVLMVALAAVVFGYFSMDRLPLTLMPELSYPTLTVRTQYPGAAPEEVENDISRPIEEALGVIGGLNRISSISRSGVSDVVLEFVWGTKMGDATQSVLEKLDLVLLPEEANRPLILHFDPSLDPIMELSFAGEGPKYAREQGLRRLRRIAELQVKRELEPISGVAAVRIRGGLEEEIHVLLDEEQLRRANISIATVVNRLAQENINMAGGTIIEGRAEYMVRTLNEFENLDQIRDTMVSKIGDRILRVRDLGEVVRTHKDREIVTRTNGRESVMIDIYKEGDANMVALAKRVKATIGMIQETPAKEGPDKGQGRAFRQNIGLAQRLFQEEQSRLEVVADRSIFIENSISEVKNTAILGGFLAVIVLFLFLRQVKSTVIIGISIPVSLLIAFAPLNLLGVSLNIMSLGGLALGIGMLVDSSIVVLESIYRCREEGDSVVAAAIRGAGEVRGAVIASTLTSIAVFFPMVFVEGIAGQIFGDLGLAVVTSLTASLAVAIWLIPMLASRTGLNLGAEADQPSPGAGAPRGWVGWARFRTFWKGTSGWKRWLGLPYHFVRLVVALPFETIGKLIVGLARGTAWLLRRLFVPALAALFGALAWLPLKGMDGLLRFFQSGYPPLIRWAMRSPVQVLLLVALSIGASWAMVGRLDSELLPDVHQGEFTLETNLPVGTPLEETMAVMGPVEEKLMGDPYRAPVRNLITTFGFDVNNTQRSDDGEHSSKFKVLLNASPRPKQTEERAIERMRSLVAAIPDVSHRVTRPVLFSAATPIEVEIHGTDLRVLRDLADRARELLAGLPDLGDVESTLKRGAPEIQIRYDRDKITQFGLDLDQIAKLVRTKVRGDEATKFNLRERRVPIMVQLREGDRTRVGDIGRLTINPDGPHPVPLESVAELTLDEGPSEVRRVDGSRVALLTANLRGASLGSVAERIATLLSQEIVWPDETGFVISGQSREWERSRNSLLLALFLSIFLVYVIMASQFESLLYPLVIMFTIPLAAVGAVFMLFVMGISLSVVVFLGLIMLAGIVVNNAIVLVDYINTLKQRGMGSFEAIVLAGQVRLRPILMTTATTILGLLPMALGAGDGAEIRQPMALTVIGGLISSTILTLIVIPSIYYQIDTIKARLVGRSLTAGTEPAQAIDSRSNRVDPTGEVSQ